MMRYVAVVGEREITLEVNSHGEMTEIHLGEDAVDVRQVSQTQYSLLLNGKSYLLNVEKNAAGYEVSNRNRTREVLVKDETDMIRERYGMGDALADLHGVVQAPIPGLVVRLEVSEGDEVAKDDGLMVLEAMKMENEIKAPVAGVISKIHVAEGDNIEKDTVLIEIESE